MSLWLFSDVRKGKRDSWNASFFHFPFFRERLIHLLALRPFKKLELYDRLNRGECCGKAVAQHD